MKLVSQGKRAKDKNRRKKANGMGSRKHQRGRRTINLHQLKIVKNSFVTRNLNNLKQGDEKPSSNNNYSLQRPSSKLDGENRMQWYNKQGSEHIPTSININARMLTARGSGGDWTCGDTVLVKPNSHSGDGRRLSPVLENGRRRLNPTWKNDAQSPSLNKKRRKTNIVNQKEVVSQKTRETIRWGLIAQRNRQRYLLHTEDQQGRY